MKRGAWIIGAAGLAITAAVAAAVGHLKYHQRLGTPGVRWVAEGAGLRGRIELPERVLDYVSTNVEPSALEWEVLPKDTSLARRLYRAPDGFEVLLGVVLMGTDRTSIHKPEYCLTSQGWQIVGRATSRLSLDRPHPYTLPVRQFVTRRLGQLPDGRQARWSGVYLFWFVADGRLTASHWGRVGWLAWDLIRHGVMPRWAYVSAFVGCPPGQEESAAARAREFLRAAVPEFQRTVGPREEPAR
jgi:EpsI family protein